MRPRNYLAAGLTLACLTLAGCGSSSPANEQLPPLTTADLAEAQAAIDLVNAEEKAQGGLTPPSTRRKSGGMTDEMSNQRSLSGGR